MKCDLKREQSIVCYALVPNEGTLVEGRLWMKSPGTTPLQ